VLELLQGVSVNQLASRVLSALQFEEAPSPANAVLSMEEIQQLIEQANSGELELLLAELEQTLEAEAAV
jgi:hypothetical protein